MSSLAADPLAIDVKPETLQDAEPGSARGVDLSDLFRIVSERRYILFGGALAGLLLGLLASLLITPMYRATALLELNSPNTQVIDDANLNARGPQSVNSQELLATQLGLLRSESLARRVVQELNLVSNEAFGGVEGNRERRTDQAVRIIQANTLVEADKGSLLINVGYSSPDPELAARIANALAKGFIASSLERRYDSSSYARDFLSDQLAATKDALEQSERALNAYAIQSGIFRAPDQISNGVTTEGASLVSKNLDLLTEALVEARVKRIAAETAYRNVAGDANAAQSESTATLRQQRALLQSEYEQKAQIFKPDYPEMQELQSRIEALDRSIASEGRATAGGRRADLRAAFGAARETENALAARVDAMKSEVQGERSTSIQYNILKREADTNRALYDALLQRYKEIGVAGGIGQSFVSLIDEADPPLAPYRPNLLLNAAAGLLLGLILGVLLAVIVHLVFDNIVTPQDVRSKLRLPVLGVIPAERDGRPIIEVLEDRKSDISEAYYSVRTALRFAGPGGVPRTLLLTSGRPGEGKSTSAYAIASSFARTGERVLLIDADLRKPTFVSQQAEGRGLAALLTSEDRLLGQVELTKTENLSLLPVGRFHGSPAELLGSTRLASLIEEARAAFDLVVIDGPPVLGLADAPILGALAEKTLIVIESREARTSALTEMVRRMHAAGADIIGVILTKVSKSGSGYGYNYYSYSYGEERGGRVSSQPGRALDVGMGAD